MNAERWAMVAWKNAGERMLGQCLAEPGSYREERWMKSMVGQGARVEAFTRGEWDKWTHQRKAATAGAYTQIPKTPVIQSLVPHAGGDGGRCE